MLCLRFGCSGKYYREDSGLDYYGRLYSTGDIQRIFAEEHTGLLTRESREELERRFKAGAADRRPWDPNLLSCTPTLEMGIDIGDLSTVVLCSVPPAQANYLQRIGRAGRRDGNALNLTVANARPHDLYFFTNPMEMLAGRVEPPGVFLNASAVLEQQFTAFCFDRWVESGISETALPHKLGHVLNSLEPAERSKLPHHRASLFDPSGKAPLGQDGHPEEREGQRPFLQ
jgi:DEAD/DEAH box helicase domain-containing protein